MKIAYVEWRSWQNYGGEHFTAEIEINDEWIDVEYKLTESQAIKLNKANAKNYPSVGVSLFERNKTGDLSKRFNSFPKMLAGIMKLAIKNNIDLLFVGNGVTSPSEVIYSKKSEHKLKLNMLYYEYRKNNSDKNIDNWEYYFNNIKTKRV